MESESGSGKVIRWFRCFIRSR